ncbi:MAG: hypothetical protein ACLT4A_10565 [Anaerobutyricum soehngenii]
MAKIAYGECTIINVEEPFSVILSNEAQSIPTDANRKVTKDFVCYTDIKVTQGMTPHTDFIIGNISSANGITVTKSSARITFTVKAGTTISADTGTFNIPITLGEDTVTKVFSWCCQKEGAAAKSVKVIAESTVFKSTDGGETFSPDIIRITPTFQGGITFSKWQYSIDSGTTWKDITNGKNGLTISSSTLIVSKTCDLYTNAITAISFKCFSNNSAYYDIITISKLGDSISKIRKIESTVDDLAGEIKSKVEETTIFEVTDENGKVKKTLKDILSSSTQDLYGFKREVKQQYNDLEIGGVNLFVQNTVIEGKYLSSENVEINDAAWGYSDYINVGDMDYYIASGFTNLGNAPATCFYSADKVFLSGVKSELANSKESKRKMLQIPDGAVYMRFSFLLADAKTLKIEKGIKSTSYSPSPDDVAHNIKTVEEQTKDMFSWLVESGSSETSLKITNGLIEAITGKFVVKSPNGKSVVIENGAINAESITTDMLSANSITAEKIMADALKSRNYVTGESGSFLNLEDGSFDSKYLKWDNAGKVIANDITVVGGSINVNDKFIVNNDGIATLQGATVVGNITAESGKIGKFNLDNLALVTGDTDVTCAGLGGSSQAFWAGSLSMDDAPFRVGYDGKLYASDADISGVINSTDGSIGGWKISNEGIKSFYSHIDTVDTGILDSSNSLSLLSDTSSIILNYDGKTYSDSSRKNILTRGVDSLSLNEYLIQGSSKNTVYGEENEEQNYSFYLSAMNGLEMWDNISGDNIVYSCNGITFNNRIKIDGLTKVLWEGVNYMSGDQIITFYNETVSDQLNGIALVWSRYNTNTHQASNSDVHIQFIPKWCVEEMNGAGHAFIDPYRHFDKYFRVYNDKIVGNDVNGNPGTEGGLSYDNRNCVLRAVIGV